MNKNMYTQKIKMCTFDNKIFHIIVRVWDEGCEKKTMLPKSKSSWCLYILVLMCLSRFCFSNVEEVDLKRYEQSLYSEHGEDGVLSKIFQLIKPTSKFCVNLGAGDEASGSLSFLLQLQNWNCVLIDKIYENKKSKFFSEFLMMSNVNDVFEKYQIPEIFDLLCIDLDYNDFYIWKALDPRYTPSVVVISYNAMHMPGEDKIVQYLPFFCGDATTYFGSGILPLYHLGRMKGYSLAYANGFYLIFIREQLLKDNIWHFKDLNDVEKIYRFAPKGIGFHTERAQDFRSRVYLTFKEAMNLYTEGGLKSGM